MKNSLILKIYLIALCLTSMPAVAQNMASIEVPLGISFVYGFDYHPAWYTQVKPTMGFGLTNGGYLFGKSTEIQYAFIVEQRYYYNMVKRLSEEKNTRHKSADYFSFKPTCVYRQMKTDGSILFPESKYNEQIYYCTANWGIRRALGKCFYFDGSIGIGPSYRSSNKRFKAMIDLNLNIGLKLF